MTVAFALAAALFYGAADFCGGLASRRVASLAVVVWSQAAGLAVLLPALLVVPGVPRASDLAWGLACGLAGAFAIALLYRGLAIGTMGVVSPVTAVLASASPAPPSPAGADAPLARAPRARRLPPGIPEALGAGAAFGFFFIALAQTHADAGLYPLLPTPLASIAILGTGALLLRRPLRVGRAGLPTIVAAGLLDMGANVFYVLAAHAGALSVAAVITSLYPAGTVALAAAVLHERLVRVQWIGVTVALTGVLCISLAR